jgi:hypothetical protein
VQVDGDVIQYVMNYEKDGPDAKCMCKVKNMTSLVTGLKEGKRYTFKYRGMDCDFADYSFTFDKGLHQIIELDSLDPLGE